MLWDNYVRKATAAVGKSDYAEADQLLKQALQYARENFSADDGRLGLTLSLLGQLYFKSKDFAQAETLLEGSLKLQADCGKLDYLCALMDLFSLCQIKGAKGELEQALDLYDQTLNKIKADRASDNELMRQAGEHFEKLFAMSRRSLTSAPRSATASKGLSALTAGSQAAPVSHAEHAQFVTTAQGSGARAALTNSAYQSTFQAEPAVVAQSEPSGFYDLWTRQFRTGLASLADADAEEETVISAYLNLESALRLARNVFASGDLRLAQTMAHLAEASDRLGLYDQAEMLLRLAISFVKPATVSAVSDVLTIKLQFLSFCIKHDRYYAAESLLSEIEQYAVNAVKESPEYVRATAGIADMRKRYKAYVAAQDLLMQAVTSESAGTLETAAKMYGIALSMIRQAFRPDHPDVAQILRCRANTVRKLGNPDQADELEDRAERIEKANEAARAHTCQITASLPRPEIEMLAVKPS